MAVEPPPSQWEFPDPRDSEDDLVGVGADLESGTILAAYRVGLFPMPLRRRLVGWWSPMRRGILPLDSMRVTDSLRRSRKRYEIRLNTSFAEVVAACADPSRPHGWITPAIERAYVELHELGWAHSVEAWSLEDGTLAGGLYGVAIGGLFAGESMFHVGRDASKVALCGLVDILAADVHDAGLVDCQWLTPHLASLGAVEIPREDYLARLPDALAAPLPRELAGDRTDGFDHRASVSACVRAPTALGAPRRPRAPRSQATNGKDRS